MAADFNQTIITIAAVSVSLLGNTINAIGYIIEKKAHINLQSKNRLLSPSKQKSYATDCLWLSGFITFALGSILHAGALAFGPQSLLTPVTSVTLVVNTFLAHKYLNEPLRKQDIFGTVLIIIGCVVAVIFGPRTTSTERTTANDLLNGFTNASFSIFFGLLTFCIITDYIIVKIFERRNQKLNEIAHDVIKKSFESSHSKLSTNIMDCELNENESSSSNNDDDGKEGMDTSIIRHHNPTKQPPVTPQSKTSISNLEINKSGDETKLPQRIYKGRTFLMLSYTTIGAYWGSVNVLLTKAFARLGYVSKLFGNLLIDSSNNNIALSNSFNWK